MFLSSSKQTIVFSLRGGFGGREGDLRHQALPDAAPEGAVVLHLALLIHLLLGRLEPPVLSAVTDVDHDAECEESDKEEQKPCSCSTSHDEGGGELCEAGDGGVVMRLDLNSSKVIIVDSIAVNGVAELDETGLFLKIHMLFVEVNLTRCLLPALIVYIRRCVVGGDVSLKVVHLKVYSSYSQRLLQLLTIFRKFSFL